MNNNAFKVEITKLTSWKEVLNSARFTQGKEPLDKEPSEHFKKNIIKAGHSPLRTLVFNIDFYNIPYYVSTHLVRHVHAQPFVSTSRPDVNGNVLPREEQKKNDLVNMRLFLSAEEIINISKLRLCNKAEKETRRIWGAAVEELKKQEPLLAYACVPSCIFRNGICAEMNSCEYNKSKIFDINRKDYLKNLSIKNKEE